MPPSFVRVLARHEDPAISKALEERWVARFQELRDFDLSAIRQMHHVAERAHHSHLPFHSTAVREAFFGRFSSRRAELIPAMAPRNSR